MPASRRDVMQVMLTLGVVAVAFLGSGLRWVWINRPMGKFSTVSEYLGSGRTPKNVSSLSTNGSTFFIAYGRMDDCWLAIPSGPPAYVFDESGRLVAWCQDVGDSDSFDIQWPWRQQKKSSVEELRKIGLAETNLLMTPLNI